MQTTETNVAQLREELEAEQLKRMLADIKAVPIRESFGSFVDPYEYLHDDPSFLMPWLGPGLDVRSDRHGGMDRPVFQSEHELAQIRGMGRHLSRDYPAGITIKELLGVYTIGTGFGYKCRPVSALKQDESVKALAADCQRAIDMFCEQNEWVGDLERELHDRSREDGEAILDLQRQGWRTKATVVEPSSLVEPANGRQFEEYYPTDYAGPQSWTFGVRTPEADPSQPLGYHFIFGMSGTDWAYRPADQIVHIKRNVPRNVKRGVSDYKTVAEILKGAEKLLRNTGQGAAVQAAIAYIREHGTDKTPSQVTAFADGKQYATYQRPTPSGGLQTQRVSRAEPGTIVDTNSSKYIAGPLGAGQAAEGYIMVVNACLRYAGARWLLPEYMISSDASNGNYSSLMVAESPCVKARESEQAFYAGKYKRVMWTVLKNAWLGGFFAHHNAEWEQIERMIDVHVTPPTVATRDRMKEAQASKIEADGGILSAETWSQKSGYDYDEEVAKGAKKAEPVAPQGGAFGGDPFGDDQQTDAQGKPVRESYDEGKHPRAKDGKWVRGVGGKSHTYHDAGGKPIVHVADAGEGEYHVTVQHPTKNKHKTLSVLADSSGEAKHKAMKAANAERAKAVKPAKAAATPEVHAKIKELEEAAAAQEQFAKEAAAHGDKGNWPAAAKSYASSAAYARERIAALKKKYAIMEPSKSDSSGPTLDDSKRYAAMGFNEFAKEVRSNSPETAFLHDDESLKWIHDSHKMRAKSTRESEDHDDWQEGGIEVLMEAQVHAPHNMVIAGKPYAGGEFIPNDKLGKATPQQKAEIQRGIDVKDAKKEKAVRGEMKPAKRADIETKDAKGKTKKIPRLQFADGSQVPDHIPAGKIPGAWKNVTVSTNPDDDVWATGVDEKGRTKTVYSDSFEMRQAAIKFARNLNLVKEKDKVAGEIQEAMKSNDKATAEAAACMWLIQEQATRPGSDKDTGGKVKAYGATTLRAEHVVSAPDGVRLQFIGKEGVYHDHLIKNQSLAKELLRRKATAEQRNGKIFDTTDGKLLAFSKQLDSGRFTPKDFRTLKATTLATEVIKELPKPTDAKSLRAAVMEVATRVSRVLGNKPAQALESYINPMVFSGWRIA